MKRSEAFRRTESKNEPEMVHLRKYLEKISEKASNGEYYYLSRTLPPNMEALKMLKDEYGYTIYIREPLHDCLGYASFIIYWGNSTGNIFFRKLFFEKATAENGQIEIDYSDNYVEL